METKSRSEGAGIYIDRDGSDLLDSSLHCKIAMLVLRGRHLGREEEEMNKNLHLSDIWRDALQYDNLFLHWIYICFHVCHLY